MDNLDTIVGRTLIKVEQNGEEKLILFFKDGSRAEFFHQQNCCEDVHINDVNGDWSDLYGHPLLVAEKRTDEGFHTEGTFTWTFYTFRSVGGSVDVRWYGESNGYYSEEVDCKLYEKDGTTVRLD